MVSKDQEVAPRLTRKKKLLFSLVTLLILLLILEFGTRAYFAYKVGPSVLAYGTRLHRKQIKMGELKDFIEVGANLINQRANWNKIRNVHYHTNRDGNYSKYFPHQKRFDFDVETGERFEVQINGKGFRGKEFDKQKSPGVIRVVTLGASSTFGYFNRDDTTYPVYLEQFLNERNTGDAQFEVINLGIPHQDSAKIHALFLAEGIQLDPDIVTFYEGNNDVAPGVWFVRTPNIVRKALVKVGDYSLLFALFHSILKNRTVVQDVTEFEQRVSALSRLYIDHISDIEKECRDRGITFIVANQQENSQSIDREMLKGITYQEEVEKVRAKLRRIRKVNPWELTFLAHSVLMKDLSAWAKVNQIPFVDVISRLDQDRDVMMSWVHLSPKGNRMVAEAFAEEIIRHTSKVQTDLVP